MRQVSIRVNPFNYLGKAFFDLSVILPHAIFRVRKSSYIQCFNTILSCPSTKFKLGLLIFIDVAFLLYCTVHVIFSYRTIIFYTPISIFKYVFICGGHHDNDRMAVSVMVSQAESIVF